uniref:Filamentous haemagglutinin family outer membrane protein n=1 Tax=Caulobacter sp. (strain K31) TaxID=366602 RepID=B0T7Q0_CAUSK
MAVKSKPLFFPVHRSPVEGARQALFLGASAMVLLAALGTGEAFAGPSATTRAVARLAATGAGAPSVAVPVVPGVTPNAAMAAARALQNATRVQQAVNLAQQAQVAGRQAASALISKAPNGLVAGGLAPATDAAYATGGMLLWQGANTPTQSTSTSGRILVDIKQTDSRAILSWDTFNVGANTTLNFDQSQNGVAQPDWIVLNRVVGQLNPVTGLRDPSKTPAPSQILGAITAQGTVLVINQNGVLFGGTSQINTRSLIASSLEVGRGVSRDAAGVVHDRTIADRNADFLTGGLLGVNVSANDLGVSTFSAMNDPTGLGPATIEGAITVDAGAQITAGDGGLILLAGPQVVNSGMLSAQRGQVSLVSGRSFILTASDGSATSLDPNVRGLVVGRGHAVTGGGAGGFYVRNSASGLIQSREGYASLYGAVINEGVITATTSVSRNGSIDLGGANGDAIQLAPGSVIAITPDDTGSIPQDAQSLAAFKPSRVTLGNAASQIEIGSNSLIYAPGATVEVGSKPGVDTDSTATAGYANARIFIDSGATIDVAGLKNVIVPASRNVIVIDPVKGNELADSPLYRQGFLNGAKIYLDPRISGVREDGVAYIGSPLISAESYAQQVGVTASELLTKGGAVTLGVPSASPTAGVVTQAPDVIVKRGATIDISGGWRTFEAGRVRTTRLIDANGGIVDIGYADPNATYVGVYEGFVDVQPRFGVTRTYVSPILDGGDFVPSYTEGTDAGSLTIKSSQPLFEGTLYADAFPGLAQKQAGQVGTAKPVLYGDRRRLQAVSSQLPSGGLLSIQELGLSPNGVTGGGDIRIIDGAMPATADSLTYGQSLVIDGQGNLSMAARPVESMIPAAQRGVLTFGADTLSAMGLGQLSLFTSGALTVESGADLTLTPGGVFTATTGRAITIDGDITAASGTIALETVATGRGSVFKADPAGPGSYDVTINGQLSTAGLWTNDLGASSDDLGGAAYVDGGKVSISAAPRALLTDDVVPTSSGSGPATNVDISGSILIDGPRSRIDVSSGGYVATDGDLDLTARGGAVTLTSDTTYFQLTAPPGQGYVAGQAPGIRVTGLANGAAPIVPVNPSEITARVSIGQDTIVGHGFAGGGTFSLTTPAIAFGDGVASTGTELPLDFFSKAGFSTYTIKSYGTDLSPNTFNNGLGGYNAVLKTQVLTVGDGQTLNLTQSGYSTRPDAAQTAALRTLRTGGAVTSVLTAGVQPQAWDQAPISLTFDGLIELKVAQGGQIIGAPGARIGASQILNQGTIRLAGGAINQVKSLPALYATTTGPNAALSAASLSDIFTVKPDGTIDEAAPSKIDPTRTNRQVAAQGGIYLTGDLPADVGVQLDAGSVTDLSGVSIRNPYAIGVDGRQIVTGRVYGGGAITTAPTRRQQGALFADSTFSRGVYRNLSYQSGSFSAAVLAADVQGSDFIAAPGAAVNLSGVSDTFDQLQADGGYAPTLQWSSAGALSLGAGGVLTGATITAKGGGPAAAGGVLVLSNPTLTQNDPTSPTRNLFSANQIEAAGFDTLVVRGALRGQGDVALTLDGAFELTSPVYDGVASLNDPSVRQNLSPVVGAIGQLDITASYVRLDGAFQSLATPAVGTAGTGQVTLHAQSMDVAGAVLFDRSVANTTFDVTGDLRFSGVAPYQVAFDVGTAAPSLAGQLAVNGNLLLRAGQVYATTGSSVFVSSAASDGVLTVERASSATPATPYSAGSNLTLQAASIVQNGVLRAPLGVLTLGGNSASLFAPATRSVVLGEGGITSVSAAGLSIPYGTTTDQTEYFFNPTNANPLTAPPTGVLTLAAGAVTTAAGATVDISGGGDVYAYEFVPGPGGTRDVLSQFNPDVFTGNDGYQYADHRQVYAIVPGLSDGSISPYDPIYSSNYGELYQAANAGRRVYLEGGQGLAAGWYTLLPAQYALLPGGMRVVENTAASGVAAGATAVRRDGTLVTTGRYGGVGGVEESRVRVFEVQSQSVIHAGSNIVQTSANTAFAAAAAKRGEASPVLPRDAGRLVFAPLTSLDLNGRLVTTPGKGGRGGQADISGQAIEIVTQRGTPTAGVIQLDADQLSGLNVDSLLIGGVRTDRADGSTGLAVTANTITVANNATAPLTGPEILLAVDGAGSRLTIQDGATITATASSAVQRTGDYLIDGAGASMTGQGALVRVTSGSDRDVVRTNVDAVSTGGLVVGAATLIGKSMLLDSSAGFTIAPTATLAADTLTLSASEIHFADAPDSLAGLVLTPGLQAALGRAQGLRLRTANRIDFAAGDYHFGDLTLVAPGVALAGGSGDVRIFADDLRLESRSVATAACGASGPLACGTGALTLDGRTVTLGDGALHTYGAGGGVSVNAREGLFYDGKGSLDVGAAGLTIQTPFLGDRAAQVASSGATPTIPSLSLVSTGVVTIANAAGGARPTAAGVAGSSLTIAGRSLSVSGVDVRATAGKLTLTATDALTIGAGALIETPGYAKSFGDAVDPYSVSAPGGLLTLTSVNGDVRMAAGSTLSVGGGLGASGTLAVNAGKGEAVFGGAVDASTPDGGARFALNQAGGFDLSGFVRSTKGGFDGGMDVQTGAGDLVLADGLALKARSVSLVADGGQVAVDGSIDTSGANGGDIRLFGATGVTLGSKAVLNARALGYDDSATRTAEGGTVQLGVGQSGAIDVATGAKIDVGARHDKARLVTTVENGVVNYRQVAADTGGALVLRAPVLGPAGGQTVDVHFAGSVVGADSVVLEGYRAFDLAAIAADSRFTGVTVAGQTATLNLAATAAGRENFLAGTGVGTLSDFIKTFDVSSIYGRLGGLAGQANFHARPGVELNYDGSILLASNWNLGAGTVDVAGAMNAGLMAAHPGISGAVYVVPGSEGRILANYTDMTYHVGGKATGEGGVLTLRATDDVTLNGSLTDGFFTFADQSDPAYLNRALGGGTRTYDGVLNSTCTGSCVVGDFTTGAAPANTVTVNFPGATGLGNQEINTANPAPYNAAANSPAALGVGAGGKGDAIGSAELFPLIETAGGTRAVDSWSYQITAGARASDAGVFSVDPLRVQAGAAGNLKVAGTATYSYGGVAGNSSLTNTLLLGVANGDKVAADQWVQAQMAQNPGLTTQSYTRLQWTSAPAALRTVLAQRALAFLAQHPGEVALTGPANAPTGVSTSLSLAGAFLAQFANDWPTLKANYSAPRASTPSPTTVTTTTLMRTGTGSITLAAAGDIDLRNGEAVTYRNILTGADAPGPGPTAYQVGGVAVYTAGHRVIPEAIDAVDPKTGAALVLDPSAYSQPAVLKAQTAGGGAVRGLALSQPVYATGGGDVSLLAGGDVLSRRDLYTAAWVDDLQIQNLTGLAGYVGTGEQPWRMGFVGMATDLRINPQLFTEGAGTLGGGDIRVVAGGDVSDLSVVADTTVTTANVAEAGGAARPGRTLLTFGGGDVMIEAGGEMLGGRIDMGAGQGEIRVGGDLIRAAGTDNGLRLRLSDATINLSVRGAALVEGITALGVKRNASSGNIDANATSTANALGFYAQDAGVSVLSNGNLTIANSATLRGDGGATNTQAANALEAIYPGSLSAVSLSGDLAFGSNTEILLTPTARGTLTLAAGGDIAPATIAMLDNDPGVTPGVFSRFIRSGSFAASGMAFDFPVVLPTTSLAARRLLHNPRVPRSGDAAPNRIYAGGDIGALSLSTPKQTRIGAGRDIVNMMFFGQNLNVGDVTRVVAGRDITATTVVRGAPLGFVGLTDPLPVLQGNSFVIGGPGTLSLEAGRDLGPFLNSAIDDFQAASDIVQPRHITFGGGVMSVGNEWNPWLAPVGANLDIQFGVAKGADFTALRETYLDPTNLAQFPDYLFVQAEDEHGAIITDRTKPIYGPALVAWMQANAGETLQAAFGTTKVDYVQAYQAFTGLSALRQRGFLQQVYFNELTVTSIPGPSFQKYSRGYTAVNTLFPASRGYTANDLTGGSNGANLLVRTGDLDLRLATIQTARGGDISILGPGGRVLAGSTVSTAQQAARRNYAGRGLFSAFGAPVAQISAIPIGFEGVLTLRGGDISSFTDGDFILNQSRLFTEQGGDVAMWSSNGDLNAGQGPKTSPNFPPVVVKVSDNANSEVDQTSAVSGAGIAAFQPAPGVAPPNAYLIAPRGTVDAGDAGVRVAGNLFVAALSVANADNFKASGSAIGVPTAAAAPVVGAETSAAGNAVTQAAQQAVRGRDRPDRSIITVDVLGFGEADSCPTPNDPKCPR